MCGREERGEVLGEVADSEVANLGREGDCQVHCCWGGGGSDSVFRGGLELGGDGGVEELVAVSWS